MGEDYFGEGAEAASTTLDCVTRIDPTKPRLSHTEWRRLERAHQARVDALTAAHLARRSRGERHPVEDFLWTYYSVKPAELRRWHPGAGVLLEDGSEDRQITVPQRSGELKLQGMTYLLHFAHPNFWFHVTTAYAILRHHGVEIGKLDFIGAQPTA